MIISGGSLQTVPVSCVKTADECFFINQHHYMFVVPRSTMNTNGETEN